MRLIKLAVPRQTLFSLLPFPHISIKTTHARWPLHDGSFIYLRTRRMLTFSQKLLAFLDDHPCPNPSMAAKHPPSPLPCLHSVIEAAMTMTATTTTYPPKVDANLYAYQGSANEGRKGRLAFLCGRLVEDQPPLVPPSSCTFLPPNVFPPITR